MSGTQRTRLTGHLPVPSTQTGGGCLIFFALPFVVIGLGVMAMSLGYLPLEGEINGPPQLLTVFGGVFAAAGLGLSWAGIAGMARARAARKRKEEHPLEPWFWDHGWDSRWATHGSLKPAIHAFGFFFFLAAFLSMFHWWAFFSDEGPMVVKIVVVVFDLVALAVLYSAVYQLFQYFKYGQSRLHFARFPFRPGRHIEGGLELSRKVSAAPSISLTLRYIEEVTETTGSGKNRSSQQVLYCLHEVKQELSASQFDLEGRGEIPISIRLPEGNFANRLIETPRRYWELEVKAETPGIDYDAKFLLPVY
jgi:hypothetical protein